MVNTFEYSEKEELILQSAMDVFTEKGFHGTKMQEIADRAGINKALLHYYFRNKERLYEQIFRMVLRKFILSVTEAFQQEDSFSDILRSFIDRFLDVLKQDSRIPMFIANELGQGGKTVSRMVSDVIGSSEEPGPWTLIERIEEGKARKEIAPHVDSRQFLLTVMGSCIYFFIAEPIIDQIFSGPDAFDRDRFLEDRKQSIFNTLYYGIQNRENGNVDS